MPCQRRLKLPMALARSEEDGDVAGPYGAGKPGLAIAHNGPGLQQAGDLAGGDLGALLGVSAEHHA